MEREKIFFRFRYSKRTWILFWCWSWFLSKSLWPLRIPLYRFYIIYVLWLRLFYDFIIVAMIVLLLLLWFCCCWMDGCVIQNSQFKTLNLMECCISNYAIIVVVVVFIKLKRPVYGSFFIRFYFNLTVTSAILPFCFCFFFFFIFFFLLSMWTVYDCVYKWVSEWIIYENELMCKL